MSNFSQSIRIVPPPVVVDLPASAWAQTWQSAPTQAVRVGLRLLAANDYTTARAVAADKACTLHPEGPMPARHDFQDAYNDALMIFAVARGTCDPSDISLPWLEAAEDNLGLALTPDGVRYLWDALERLRVQSSPLIEPWQGDMDGLSDLPTPQQTTCRKLLAYVHEALRG